MNGEQKLYTAFWILLAIFIIIVVLAIIALFVAKGKKTPPDYYVIFVLGLTWLPLGITTNRKQSLQ